MKIRNGLTSVYRMTLATITNSQKYENSSVSFLIARSSSRIWLR